MERNYINSLREILIVLIVFIVSFFLLFFMKIVNVSAATVNNLGGLNITQRVNGTNVDYDLISNYFTYTESNGTNYIFSNNSNLAYIIQNQAQLDTIFTSKLTYYFSNPCSSVENLSYTQKITFFQQGDYFDLTKINVVHGISGCTGYWRNNSNGTFDYVLTCNLNAGSYVSASLYFSDFQVPRGLMSHYRIGIENNFKATCDVNTQSIIDSSNANTQNQINNNNANTDKIIENENSNANKIIENQNKNAQDIKEQNTEAEKTRKGIWGTIKDVLSTLVNLPSKLISGFFDMLKALFIPSEDFFEDFINDFKQIFLKKLGFLAYPFELIGDIFDRYMNVQSNPVINIPQINEPFTGGKLISATSVNLKEIFEHGAIGTMYSIYRSCVSVLIIVMFLNFSMKKYDEFVKNKGSDS